MKILHVIPFLSAESGGPAVSTLLPVRYLNGMGKDIENLMNHLSVICRS